MTIAPGLLRGGPFFFAGVFRRPTTAAKVLPPAPHLDNIPSKPPTESCARSMLYPPGLQRPIVLAFFSKSKPFIIKPVHQPFYRHVLFTRFIVLFISAFSIPSAHQKKPSHTSPTVCCQNLPISSSPFILKTTMYGPFAQKKNGIPIPRNINQPHIRRARCPGLIDRAAQAWRWRPQTSKHENNENFQSS